MVAEMMLFIFIILNSLMSNYEWANNKLSSTLFCTCKHCAPNAQTAVNLFSGVMRVVARQKKHFTIYIRFEHKVPLPGYP